MDKRIKKSVFLLLICFLATMQSVAQQTQSNSITPEMLIGVWPYSNNPQSLVEKEFSWGIGVYVPNDSIIIDYDEHGDLVIQNPGLGSYRIASHAYHSHNEIKLFLEKVNRRSFKSIPDQGSVIVTMISPDEIMIDDSNYAAMFGSPGNHVLIRVSP